MSRPRLAVVVPVYHNAPTLRTLHERLVALEAAAGVDVVIWCVDDGSGDESLTVLRQLADADARVRVLRLARNHGSFTAIRAGLDHARDADVAAVISADLQDPPEHLSPMLEAWRGGAEIVLASRRSREDPWLSRIASMVFHGLFRRFVEPRMPPGGFDFFLLDARAARALRRHRERLAYLPALVVRLGFRQTVLPFDRQRRPVGKSMWTMRRKLALFIDAFAVHAGGCFLRLPLLWGGAALVATPWCDASNRWLFALAGMLGIALGVLGEAVWRLWRDQRAAPLYVVAERLGVTAPRSEGRAHPQR